MRINFGRAFEAPFKSEESSIGIIYLIATGFMIALSVIPLIIQVIISVIAAILEMIAGTSEVANIISFIVIAAAALIMFTILFLIYVVPVGYIIETIHYEALNKVYIMPAWKNNILKFAWKGFKAILLYLILFIINIGIIIIPSIALALLIQHTSGNMEIISILLGILLFLYVFISIILLIFIALPMSFVAYASEDKLIAAFNIPKILIKILMHPLEIILTIIMMIVLTILTIIIDIILFCTVCGVLIIPLVNNFILVIIVCNLFAQIYKDGNTAKPNEVI